MRKVLPVLVVSAAFLLGGCPNGEPPPALKQRLHDQLASAEFQTAMAGVLDGDGLDDCEYRIERRAAAEAVKRTRGWRERWLQKQAAPFTYNDLLRNPEEYRGKIVFAMLVVGEMKTLWNRDLTLLIGGTTHGEFHAYIFPRTAHQGRLYGGDVVWCSGVFIKAFRFLDARGEEHRVPLFAGPYPTYTGDWFPFKPLLRELGLEEFFPTKVSLETPPPALLLELDDAGAVRLDKQQLDEEQLSRLLSNVTEAAAISGEKGVVVLQAGPQMPEAPAEQLMRSAAQKGLRFVLRKTRPAGD